MIFGTVACARGALRRNPYSRAWFFLMIALALWSASSILGAYYAMTREGGNPFPSLSDYAYLAYVIPTVAALLAVPRSPASRISRWRIALDTLVIALGILFLSWTTVLESVVRVAGLRNFDGLVTQPSRSPTRSSVQRSLPSACASPRGSD